MRIVFLLMLLGTAGLGAQPVSYDGKEFEAVGSSAGTATLAGLEVLRVTKSPLITADDEPTFAKLRGSLFGNGTIQVKVLSRLLAGAPAHARGFIGVAFRIDEANSRFECIYIRPTNGRAEEQLRRNRAVQYFSYPGYKFDRLRKDAPGVYETYADMGLDEWIAMRIVVRGQQAWLFLNDNPQPTLVVNDLKHGAGASGVVGLFVDIGTEGFFRDLEILSD